MSAVQPNEFIAAPLSVEHLKHNNALASMMSATCPICSGTTKVVAQHMQATRQQPCKFLCVQGVCIPCQMSFDVDHVQTTLIAA